MKALSIHPQPAQEIMFGLKKIEIRTWSTNFRGNILICSTAKKVVDTIPGHAICVATLSDVRPLKKSDAGDAGFDPKDFKTGFYAWCLTNVRFIKAFPVKGKLSLWDFPEDDKIKFAPFALDDVDKESVPDELWEEYYPDDIYV